MNPVAEQTDQTTPVPADRPRKRRPLVRLLQIAGLSVALASYGVWAYVYSGQADRPTPDLLDDPAFAQQAELLCASALDDLAAGPQAFDATSGPERAEQIKAATARLETLVADLEALMGGSERDLEMLTEWLSDWRVLIGDRYRYAEAIVDDPAARYLMTDTGVGERLDRRITRMATTNRMTSCGTPQDVG